MTDKATQKDLDCIELQLGRTPRDVHAIAYRCPCGNPAVVETPPRLSHGEPFPTFYYATCPRLTGAISTLESTGLMAEMNERLAVDAELAGAYAAAHVLALVLIHSVMKLSPSYLIGGRTNHASSSYRLRHQLNSSADCRY